MAEVTTAGLSAVMVEIMAETVASLAVTKETTAQVQDLSAVRVEIMVPVQL